MPAELAQFLAEQAKAPDWAALATVLRRILAGMRRTIRRMIATREGFISMNRILVAALAVGLGLSAAAAQTAPETPPPGAAAPATPAPAATAPAVPQPGAAPSQMTGPEARAKCRADAEAQGLKGAARQAAVQDCFAKARPDLAKRQQCRMQGKAAGLAGNTLHVFVQKCIAGT